MRILQVIHDFLPHHAAGSELYTFYLSRELAKRHSVYLMFTEVDHAKEQYHYRRSSYFGIPYYEVVHNQIYRRFEDTYADPKMDRVFTRILDEVRPDVVHLQHLLNHSINYISIARRRGIRVVFTLHDYWLTCPNGGQRIRPDLHVCDAIELEHCGDCIRKFSAGGRLARRVASKVLGMRARRDGSTLLDRLPQADVETPREQFVRPGELTIGTEKRPVLLAHPPARVAFRLPAAAGGRLRFGVGMAPSTFDKPGGGVVFELHADGKEIWSRTVEAKARPEHRRWFDDEVSLPQPRNGALQLELVTRPSAGRNNQHCTAAWSGLDLTEAPGTEQARLAPAKALYRAVERLLAGDGAKRRAAQVARRLEQVRRACREVDLFIAPSPFLGERMRQFGLPAERVVVSDYGMRTDLLQPFRRRESGTIRFGYVGTLVPHKGVHVLLEAFEKLLQARGDAGVELHIHGNPAWYPDYTARLHDLAADDRVKFRGSFDNEDALEIYSGLDVLVVPSVWWENAPITIHEAIITRTPIIASDFGGMADFVKHGENGLLFRVGDAADLAQQMLSIVQEPALLDALRKPVVPIKTMERDAADMERRYLELLGAPLASEAAAVELQA